MAEIASVRRYSGKCIRVSVSTRYTGSQPRMHARAATSSCHACHLYHHGEQVSSSGSCYGHDVINSAIGCRTRALTAKPVEAVKTADAPALLIGQNALKRQCLKTILSRHGVNVEETIPVGVGTFEGFDYEIGEFGKNTGGQTLTLQVDPGAGRIKQKCALTPSHPPWLCVHLAARLHQFWCSLIPKHCTLTPHLAVTSFTHACASGAQRRDHRRLVPGCLHTLFGAPTCQQRL